MRAVERNTARTRWGRWMRTDPSIAMVWLLLIGMLLLVGCEGTVLQKRVVKERWIVKRETSPADVCARWSHQSARIGDKIYIYGGQAKTSSSQRSNRWNNFVVKLSLGSDWSTSSPKMEGLPVPALPPNGPPPVANGYLWHDTKTIYMYGGLFSDTPPTEPTEFSLWAYDVGNGKWSDVTSQTKVSPESGSKEIQRAAEGAGANVPGRSLGFYFGGHLDGYTTKGWSQSTPRVYLKSLLEFNMETKTFRNITESGLEKAGVPERADGILVFVPWGKEGILVAIGGGTNDTFSQMNIVDIYNLDTKKWTKQSTDGPTPKYRVNPCAVVASASDGSSHQIYFFGGQNLVPYMSQQQYDDMWILTIPAFTWIKVDQEDQSVPPARAGHTCDIVGSQMIVIGGYVGDELSCDSPGVYIFDASNLHWETTYSALAGGFDGKNSNNDGPGPYRVPKAVIDVIGGSPEGGAKITKPIRKADPDSPIFTGEPPGYRYTRYPTVSYATHTASDGTVTTSTNISNPGNNDDSSPKIGAIVGGVVGGIVCIVALLFLGAYILYRRKIKELRATAAMLPGSVSPGSAGKEYSDDGTSQGRNSNSVPPGGFAPLRRNGSTQDLMGEPSFWGVLLSPRRSLRVVNH